MAPRGLRPQAFFEALMAELEEYLDALEFDYELPLTTDPLRIDVVVVIHSLIKLEDANRRGLHKAALAAFEKGQSQPVTAVGDLEVVRCLVFMDDDAALSPDALSGVIESFEDKDVFGVNIPHESSPSGQRGDRRVTPWFTNVCALPEVPGDSVQWVSGHGMAFRTSVFTDMSMRFPESLQRFSGYALNEDWALSFPLYKSWGSS